MFKTQKGPGIVLKNSICCEDFARYSLAAQVIPWYMSEPLVLLEDTPRNVAEKNTDFVLMHALANEFNGVFPKWMPPPSSLDSRLKLAIFELFSRSLATSVFQDAYGRPRVISATKAEALRTNMSISTIRTNIQRFFVAFALIHILGYLGCKSPISGPTLKWAVQTGSDDLSVLRWLVHVQTSLWSHVHSDWCLSVLDLALAWLVLGWCRVAFGLSLPLCLRVGLCLLGRCCGWWLGCSCVPFPQSAFARLLGLCALAGRWAPCVLRLAVAGPSGFLLVVLAAVSRAFVPCC